MKTFANITKSTASETVFYCVRIKNALGFTEKEIFVSCPLEIDEFRAFITKRLSEHLQDRIKIVECYTSLTDTEKNEVYGLDSFARIISVINAKAKLYWDVIYYDTSDRRSNSLVDTDTLIDMIRGGANIISIKPDEWRAL